MRSPRLLAALALSALLPGCIRGNASDHAAPSDAAVANALAELEKNAIGPDVPGKSTTLADNDDHTVILMQVNGVAQLHYHKEHDEIIHFLKGSGVFNLGGVEHEARPGDLFVIPRNLVHGFKKTGDVPAAMLSIYTPRLAYPDSFRPRPAESSTPKAAPVPDTPAAPADGSPK